MPNSLHPFDAESDSGTPERSTALILGAHGFLGQHVHAVLTTAGYSVTGTGRSPGPRVDTVVDLTSDDALGDVLTDLAPDIVVNCAGATQGNTRDYVLGNVVLVHALVGALRRAPNARLVHLGSAGEYGPGRFGEPMDEATPPEPDGVYGITKLAGTEIVLQARNAGLDAVVLRPFNIIGPGSPTSTMLGGLLAQLRAPGVTAIETGPLDAWRDYVDVRDIAAAVVTAVSAKDLPPLINLGSGKAVQTREAVASLVSISGTGAAIHETAPTNATKSGPSGGSSWQLGDISRATQVLDWQPQVSLSDSLRETWTARGSATR